MKRLPLYLMLTVGVLLLVAVGVLLDAKVPFDSAVTSAVSVLMQGEFMATEPQQLPTGAKFVMSALMVAGAVMMAVIFGLITDYVFKLRLDYLLGKRGIPSMENHIILIGMGQVGFRTWEALKRFKVPVVVVEKSTDNPRLDLVRKANDAVIVDDARQDAVLEKAGIKRAKALISATNDDLANLDIALSARELAPNCRIIVRMYDQRLAAKVQAAFGIHGAFSSSALAAPVFAAAAFDKSIINSYYLGSYQVVTADLTVGYKSSLDGLTTREIERRFSCAILKHISTKGESRLYPQDDLPIMAGDKMMVSCTYDALANLKQAAGKDD